LCGAGANCDGAVCRRRRTLSLPPQFGLFDPRPQRKSKCSNDLQIRSPGIGQIRTFWDHSLILAIPFSRWGAVPYIVHPVPYPSGVLSSLVSESSERDDNKPNRIHPYHQACLWRQEMRHHSEITKAKIAAREGLSRARVTQLMNLLELPEEIQHDLQNPPSPLDIHSFTERDLRRILASRDHKSQLGMWQEMVHKCPVLVRM
jgi:hypothetical protein